MAVRKTKRRKKTVWVIDILHPKLPNGRYRRDAEIQTREAAEREHRDLLARLSEHGRITAPGDTMTLETFYTDRFQPLLSRYKPSTRLSYRSLWERPQGVRERFGKLPLPQVDGPALLLFSADLQARELQPKASVNFVKTLLRAAVDLQVLDKMPTWPKGLYKDSAKIPEAPTAEEMSLALSHARGWLRTLVALVLYTGMRQGEARGLLAQDIDHARGVIWIRRSLSENTETTTKGNAERMVAIHPELLPYLPKNKAPTDRVIATSRGKSPTRQSVLNQWKATLRRAGLPERAFHPSRHYVATSLLEANVDPQTVCAILGHSSIRVLDRYAHARKGRIVAAVTHLALGNAGNQVETTAATTQNPT